VRILVLFIPVCVPSLTGQHSAPPPAPFSCHCRSDAAGNIATFITFNTADEQQDDISKLNNKINTDIKMDDSLNNSGNDDLTGINEDKDTLSTFKEENIANNNGISNPNKNFAPDTNGDAKTDDFRNDNFVSDNDKQSKAEGDQESNKNGKLNHGTFNKDDPTSTVDMSDDDFKNDNFVSNSNNLSAEVNDFQTKNKNSNSGEDGETPSQLDSTDDNTMDDSVPSSNKQSNRGSDSNKSTTSANFVDSTSTEIDNNNLNSIAEGRSDDFQNDDFISQNNNIEIKVGDIQGTNEEEQSVADSGGTMKNFESFVNEYSNVLDDFATGDDTDEATLNNSGMVSRAELHFTNNDKMESSI